MFWRVLSRGGKKMWCVPELTDEYIEKMEDVLGTYEKPYNPAEPVVCVDEKPISLHAEVRPPSAAAPGREARHDSEYKRCGTANVFCAVEPKAGRHFTFATPDHSAVQFAQVVFRSCDAVSGSPHHPFSYGQPEHPSPQIADGPARRRRRRASLGSVHCPLPSKTRKLAESGRNRNRALLAAMSQYTSNSGPENTAAGSRSMES